MKHTEKLNEYRGVLEKRMRLFRCLWLGYLLLLVARRFLGPTFADGMIYGMLMGALTGALLVAAILMVKFRRAMQDEKQLLRLYNLEHDERMAAIRGKIGFPMVVIFGLVLMAAAMIASFFDITVALTLVIVAVTQMLVSCGLKFWYMRHM